MRQKDGRIGRAPGFTVFGVLFLSALMSLDLGSDDASAQETPPYQLDATITVDYIDYLPNNESQPAKWMAAEVGPGYSGSMQLSCDLNIQRWPSTQIKQVVITMDAHLEDNDEGEIIEAPIGAWSAAVTPRTIIIFQNEPDRPGGYTYDFDLVVRAPLRIDARASKKVVVDCYWRAEPTTVLVTSGVIHSEPKEVYVAPYYEIVMDSMDPLQTIWPGGTATFTLIINNRGNSEDDFAISFENEKFLTENGWVVQLHTTSLEVPAHSSGTFKVTIYSPQKLISTWKSEVMDIPIRVESENAPTKNDEEWEVYPVFVHIQGFNCDLWLLPPIIILIVLTVYYVRMRKKWRARRVERLKERRRTLRDRGTGKWKKESKAPPWYSREGMRRRDELEERRAQRKAGREMDELEGLEEAEVAEEAGDEVEGGGAGEKKVDVEELLKKKPNPQEMEALERKVDGFLEEKTPGPGEPGEGESGGGPSGEKGGE